MVAVAAMARVTRLSAEHEAGKARHYREGENIGGEHRQHDGDGEGDEQEARRSGQQHDREKHYADGERRDRQRQHDFGGAVENGDHERFAEGLIAMDVLDGDGRVVHQQTDGQRQAAERHQIDRLAGHQEAGDRGEDRQGDRKSDHEGVPPASEEEQDHQRYKDRRDDRFAYDIVDRGADEDGLIEIELEFDALGRRRLNFGHQIACRVDDGKGRSVAVAQDQEEDRALPVHMRDLRLGRE
jgi:hypothetical protein